MAKVLSMNGRKKIETLQREFSDKFNFLTLIFLDNENKSIDVSKSLSEVRTNQGADISIQGALKVNTLEARFKDNYGLKVEVAYSKEGKIFHTKDSVEKTLNELNSLCEKNGCDRIEFKKRLTRNTLLSVQEQLYNAIKEEYPDAVAKKINKDNFVDIHIPFVNEKRGTHLFFNTANNDIKLGFYVRDEIFVNRVLEVAENVEKYAQGLRISGNPTFLKMEDAIEAALDFIREMKGEKGDEERQNIQQSDEIKNLINFVDTIISNLDPTPIIVSDEFPLRWQSNLFLEDYDFSENHLELDHEFERKNGKYLKSVGSAIVINRDEEGGFEFWDGVYMVETHTWCSRLNTSTEFPSFLLINEKFNSLQELINFLVETYIQ